MMDEDYEENSLAVFNLGWKNPPTIEDLKKDYDSSKSYHSSVIAKIKDWRTILLAPDREFGKNRSRITPKVVKKQAEWTYPVIEEPMLASKNMYSAEAVTFEDSQVVREAMTIVNHQINKEINKVELITNATRRFVDDGTCIIKIGWDKKETYKYEFEPEYAWIPVKDPMMAQQMIMQGIPPYERKQKGWKKVLKKQMVKNAPSLEIMDPALVIIDQNAQGDLDKAQFIIEEFDTTLSDLKKAGVYKNLEKIERNNATGDSSSNSTGEELGDNNDSFAFKDKPRRIIRAVRYWGYWDIDGEGKTSPFVATWIDNTIIHIERNPLPYVGLPFETAQFKPVHKSNYGEPDAEVIKDNQEIIGAVTRGWMDMMGRSAAGQTGRVKGFLDVIEKVKYENGEDYQFNPGNDPKTAVHMHDFPELNATALNMIQMQENDVESLTGRKAFTGGISGSALGDTATGVRSAMDASAKREMGILRRFGSMFERVAIKIIAMNQVFLTDEQIIRITNSEFMIDNRDKEIGKYDLKIKINTPEQQEARAQNIGFMMQTMGNTLPFDLTKIQLAEMYELKNMPELAEKIRQYEPQPDPMEELQKQLLQAQIQQIGASTQEDMADVQLKGAKAQETMAKAHLLGSQKDLHDLDYTHKYKGDDIKGRVAEKLAIEQHKTERELTKERMKQDIVAMQMKGKLLSDHINRKSKA